MCCVGSDGWLGVTLKLWQAAVAGIRWMGFAIREVLDEADPGLLEAVASGAWCSLFDCNEVLIKMAWFSTCLPQAWLRLLQLSPTLPFWSLAFFSNSLISALRALQ